MLRMVFAAAVVTLLTAAPGVSQAASMAPPSAGFVTGNVMKVEYYYHNWHHWHHWHHCWWQFRRRLCSR